MKHEAIVGRFFSIRSLHFGLFFGLVLLTSSTAQSREPFSVGSVAMVKEKIQVLLVNNTKKWINAGSQVWILGADEERFFITLEQIHFTDKVTLNADVPLAWVSADELYTPAEAFLSFTIVNFESPDNIDALLSRGNANSLTGQLKHALADYDRAIELNPENPKSWILRANLLRRLERYDEAIENTSRAIHLAPDSLPAYLIRARLYGDAGKFTEALSDCSHIIKQQPDSIGGHSCSSYTNLMNGNIAQAIVHFEKAKKLEQALTRGQTVSSSPPTDLMQTEPGGLLGTRDVSEPIPPRKACELMPGHRERLILNGIVSVRSSLFNRGMLKLDVAASLRLPAPAEIQVLYYRAMAKMWGRQPEAASKEIEKAILVLKNKPDSMPSTFTLDMLNAEALTCRGLIAHRDGDFNQALDFYDEAIKLNPASGNAICFRDNVFLVTGQYDKALVDVETILTMRDATTAWRGNAYFGRAHVAFERGQFDTAINDLTIALGLTPANLTVIDMRSRAYLRMGQFGKAIEDCNEFVRLNPDIAAIYRTRAESWRGLKRLKNAILDYDKALSLEPKNAHLLTERGLTWSSQREWNKALQDFEAAICNDEKWAQAYDQIAWIRSTSNSAEFLDGQSAIKNATMACELAEWKSSSFIVTLAAAYAESGQFDEAQARLQQAIDLSPQWHATMRAKMIALFKEGKPYREE